MNLKWAMFLFKFGRLMSGALIIVDLIALILIYNLEGDMTEMLKALAMNLASFYICVFGVEHLEERMKGKKDE